MKEGFLLRMPPTLKEIMASTAARLGISINALILQILWQYIEGGANHARR